MAVCDWLFLCFTFWIPAHDSDLGFVCLVATKALEHPSLMASLISWKEKLRKQAIVACKLNRERAVSVLTLSCCSSKCVSFLSKKGEIVVGEFAHLTRP